MTAAPIGIVHGDAQKGFCLWQANQLIDLVQLYTYSPVHSFALRVSSNRIYSSIHFSRHRGNASKLNAIALHCVFQFRQWFIITKPTPLNINTNWNRKKRVRRSCTTNSSGGGGDGGSSLAGNIMAIDGDGTNEWQTNDSTSQRSSIVDWLYSTSTIIVDHEQNDTVHSGKHRNLNNDTVDVPYEDYKYRPETYLVPIIFGLIFIVGVVGNGTLIVVFIRHRTMRNVPNT